MDFSKISSWSIRNPIPILVLFIVLTVAGLISFGQLRVNANPDLDLPIVTVTLAQSGAAPSELENQVTRIVEDSVANLGGVKHVTSTVNEGVSTTVIEFQLGIDLDRATNDVRNAVASVRSKLPVDVLDPVVQRVDISGGAVINYVISSRQMDAEQLSWFVDNDIAKRVLTVKGVSGVERDGGVSREIRIKLDPGKLASLGITAAQLSNQLKLNNINLPGGRGEIGGAEQAIRTVGSALSVDQLRDTRINLSNGGSVRLGDLGEVTDEWAEPRGRARLDNLEVVGFGIDRTIGTSEVDVAKRARAAVAAFQKEHPSVTIREVSSSDAATKRSYDASAEALLLGAILAVIVVWVFLRDWRATFISAAAMPLSLIPTFWMMKLFNVSLNGVSMLALSLTIGILVDDAIVEIENIVRHMREGKKPYAAAIEAADEIGLAVVATTATLIAVFAPTGFMGGIAGEWFKSFAFAAVVSVFFSLVVARTLTPLMGAYLLRTEKKRTHDDEPFWMPFYQRRLAWSLNHRWIVLVGGILFFVSSIFMIPFIPTDLIPATDIGRSFCSVQLAPGATLAQSDGVVQDATRIILKRPEVESVFALVGSGTSSVGFGGGSGASEVRNSSITVNLKPRGARKLSSQQIEAALSPALQAIPGARISCARAGGGGGQTAITLVGDDPAELQTTASAVERQMRALPGLTDVASTAALLRPELVITPKPDIAAELGVSAQDLSQVARIATLGDADQLLPKYNLGDRQIPIRIMLTEPARQDLGVIRSLRVPTRFGSSVPLSAVADISFGAGPNQIDRYDRRRSATIQATLNGLTFGDAQKAIEALPAMRNLPASVLERPAGDAEAFGEIFGGFFFAIATGIVLMYLVLVLLFRSFSTPVTILVALPLSFGGAFILQLLTRTTLSLPTLIGLIMLTGVAAKNSILLVEYAIEAIRAGMTRTAALMDAAHKRARPIIMTTIAMGAGMTPIALKLGAGGEFRQPMAVAVIGGLITSTLLSLVFIPVAFTFIDDIRQAFRRAFAGPLTPEGKDEDDARVLPAE